MKCPHCNQEAFNEDDFYGLAIFYGEILFRRQCSPCKQNVDIEVGIKIRKAYKEGSE